jgi:hypothetical protein
LAPERLMDSQDSLTMRFCVSACTAVPAAAPHKGSQAPNEVYVHWKMDQKAHLLKGSPSGSSSQQARVLMTLLTGPMQMYRVFSSCAACATRQHCAGRRAHWGWFISAPLAGGVTELQVRDQQPTLERSWHSSELSFLWCGPTHETVCRQVAPGWAHCTADEGFSTTPHLVVHQAHDLLKRGSAQPAAL